ncbi:MAG: hypothetical protein ACLFTE_01200 [Salinivenus sp.]
MTVTDDAKDVLADLEMDRDDALLAAKSLSQQIIDDSASTQSPLTGVVYAVQGLYNEGTPECTFAAEEGPALVFAGTFRTADGDAVKRRRRLRPEELRAVVERVLSNRQA